MKTMLFQSNQVEKTAPVTGDFCPGAGPFKGVAAGSGFHFAEHGDETVRNGNRVGAAQSTLGLRERHGAGVQVDAGKGKPGLFHPASGVVGDFKAGAHPIGNIPAGQRLPAAGDVLLGEHRLSLHGAFTGPKVHHGHAGHVAQQPAVAVNPFENLDVLQGLVATNKAASGARRGRAPSDVVVSRGRRKILKSDFSFGHEADQVSPAVAVVDPGVVCDLVRFDQPVHPGEILASLVLLVNGKIGGLLSGSGSVQGVVGSVPRGLGGPSSVLGFVPDPIPRAVEPFVDRSHVVIVANYPKTEEKK